MQFSTTSDYAIRTVLFLALHRERCCTAGEIGAAMGIPAMYLNKITKRLKSAGILRTIQGNGGGYLLMKNPAEISLYDILSLTEQSVEINGCLEDERFCSRHAAETCPVRKIYAGINTRMKDSLSEATIQSLLDG